MVPMVDKFQDADLEKGYEVITEDVTQLFFEEDRTPLFETDDDVFEDHVLEESEFDYEPEGSFLD
jgi:hypothetical protein